MMPRSCAPSRASFASKLSGNSMKLRSNFWLISVQILHSGAVVMPPPPPMAMSKFSRSSGELPIRPPAASISCLESPKGPSMRAESLPIPAVRIRTGQRFSRICDRSNAGRRFGRDQNITGVLDVGDQTQVRPGFLFRVWARSTVCVAQELDGHCADVYGSQTRRISRREDFGYGGVRPVWRRHSGFADDARSIGRVAVITNLHVVAVRLHRRLHHFGHRSPDRKSTRL